MKKIITSIIVCLILVITVTGCTKESGTLTVDTLGKSLVNDFETISKDEKDINKIADKLSKSSALEDMNMVVEDVEDYMPGFSSEIKNYNKAVKVQPMVGSIPFIMYVFESDNPEELKSELEANKDLRWNICTEADESFTSVNGNIVFFIMAPLEIGE